MVVDSLGNIVIDYFPIIFNLPLVCDMHYQHSPIFGLQHIFRMMLPLNLQFVVFCFIFYWSYLLVSFIGYLTITEAISDKLNSVDVTLLGFSQWAVPLKTIWLFHPFDLHLYRITSILASIQIAKFMGPTWGPPGSCRPQMGPMLTPWILLSVYAWNVYSGVPVIYMLKDNWISTTRMELIL